MMLNTVNILIVMYKKISARVVRVLNYPYVGDCWSLSDFTIKAMARTRRKISIQNIGDCPVKLRTSKDMMGAL